MNRMNRIWQMQIQRTRSANNTKTIAQTISAPPLMISRGRLGNRGLAGTRYDCGWGAGCDFIAVLFRPGDFEVPIERLVERIHVVEVLAPVRLRFLHQTDVDQIVHDFAEVAGAGNAPVVQHDARH